MLRAYEMECESSYCCPLNKIIPDEIVISHDVPFYVNWYQSLVLCPWQTTMIDEFQPSRRAWAEIKKALDGEILNKPRLGRVGGGPLQDIRVSTARQQGTRSGRAVRSIRTSTSESGSDGPLYSSDDFGSSDVGFGRERDEKKKNYHIKIDIPMFDGEVEVEEDKKMASFVEEARRFSPTKVVLSHMSLASISRVNRKRLASGEMMSILPNGRKCSHTFRAGT